MGGGGDSYRERQRQQTWRREKKWTTTKNETDRQRHTDRERSEREKAGERERMNKLYFTRVMEREGQSLWESSHHLK